MAFSSLSTTAFTVVEPMSIPIFNILLFILHFEGAKIRFLLVKKNIILWLYSRQFGVKFAAKQ